MTDAISAAEYADRRARLSEHVRALEDVGARSRLVKRPADLDGTLRQEAPRVVRGIGKFAQPLQRDQDERDPENAHLPSST